MKAWRYALASLLGALALALATPAAAAEEGGQGVAQAAAGYPAVVPGRALAFPRDHGAHPDYRTEWWYITGWATDDAGVERGFQLTFFRVRTQVGETSASRFAPTQLLLAHAAIADRAEGRLLHAERAERRLEPLVGYGEAHTDVRVRDWSLHWHDDRYRARIDAGDFALALDFVPAGPPLANGRDGYSQKAPDPLNASYYYSRPQLAVSGTLAVRGTKVAVRGRAWLDHEWSSEILPEGARGWDWIGINLADGGSLMAFRLRDGAEGALWGAATWRDADGRTRLLGPDEVRFEPLRRWRSPRTGARYPVEWRVVLGRGDAVRRLRLRPLMDDQELDSRASTGAVYWEGAVRVEEEGGGASAEEADASAGNREAVSRDIGRGYLEMTGYADRLRM